MAVSPFSELKMYNACRMVNGMIRLGHALKVFVDTSEKLHCQCNMYSMRLTGHV